MRDMRRKKDGKGAGKRRRFEVCQRRRRRGRREGSAERNSLKGESGQTRRPLSRTRDVNLVCTRKFEGTGGDRPALVSSIELFLADRARRRWPPSLLPLPASLEDTKETRRSSPGRSCSKRAVQRFAVARLVPNRSSRRLDRVREGVRESVEDLVLTFCCAARESGRVGG